MGNDRTFGGTFACCDDEIDAVLNEFGGAPRKAIAALLHDINVLAADQATTKAATSCGYLRQRQPEPPAKITYIKSYVRRA